jgi:hypothetical protein
MPQTADLSSHHGIASSAIARGAIRRAGRGRLRFLVFQETPGLWLVRGLEHDFLAEGRSIGAALRAALGFVQAHTAFDVRHDHEPLCAFRAAPQEYWNAYTAGTPLSLAQLGIAPISDWEICAAVAHRRPCERRLAVAARRSL